MSRGWFSIAVASAFVAFVLVSVNARPAFPDPDSFYHAKMALMVRDRGFIRQFPWLQETWLKETYADPHLAYHVLLIPFVTALDPLVGIKAFAVLFGCLAFFAVYRSLVFLKSPFPAWLTLAAALSFDFMQRMSMPKASSLSIVLLLAAVWALARNRPKALFLITVAYVWAYHGWPVLFIAYGCSVVAWAAARRFWGDGTVRPTLASGAALVLGTIVGHVANPYFPENVLMVFQEFSKNVLTQSADVPVGVEWFPADPSALFLHNPVVTLVFLISSVILLAGLAERKIRISSDEGRAMVLYGSLAVVFFALTFRSVRFVEYLVPALTIAAGSMLAASRTFLRDDLVPQLRGFLSPGSRKMAAITGGIATVVLLARIAPIEAAYPVSAQGYYSAFQFEGSARWLREHTPEKTTVFNSRWASSMVYFYLDDGRYSLVGLDPRFMYEASPERYRVWRGLQGGTDTDTSKIQSVFGTDVVLADRRHEEFIANVEASGLWNREYRDDWMDIYVAKDPL